MTHCNSVTSIVGSFLPLLNDLYNRKLGDAAANGMYFFFTKKEVIVVLLALTDILPIKATFNTALQSPSMDLSDLKLLLNNVEIILMNMITTLQDVIDGHRNLPAYEIMPMFSKVDVFIKEVEASGRHSIKNNIATANTGRTFIWMVNQVGKFLRALITNQAARFPSVDILDALAKLFTPRDFPVKSDPNFVDYGKVALQKIMDHFQKLDANGSSQYIIADFAALCREWFTFKEAIYQTFIGGDTNIYKKFGYRVWYLNICC